MSLLPLPRRPARSSPSIRIAGLAGDFQTVQKLVGAGVLGEIIEFESHFDMNSQGAIPKLEADEGTPGTGMLFGLGAHTILLHTGMRRVICWSQSSLRE
jgi:hypothetical protein